MKSYEVLARFRKELGPAIPKNIRRICEELKIGPTTFYKWCERCPQEAKPGESANGLENPLLIIGNHVERRKRENGNDLMDHLANCAGGFFQRFDWPKDGRPSLARASEDAYQTLLKLTQAVASLCQSSDQLISAKEEARFQELWERTRIALQMHVVACENNLYNNGDDPPVGPQDPGSIPDKSPRVRKATERLEVLLRHSSSSLMISWLCRRADGVFVRRQAVLVNARDNALQTRAFNKQCLEVISQLAHFAGVVADIGARSWVKSEQASDLCLEWDRLTRSIESVVNLFPGHQPTALSRGKGPQSRIRPRPFKL
jgi:hypothetical protein